MDQRRWKLVIFFKGKRIEKIISDPRKGQEKVNELKEKGVKAHVVCRRFPKFPAKGQPEDPEQIWCPYCRRWRFFAVPRKHPVYKDAGVRCCKWCGISEEDSFVKTYNPDLPSQIERRRGKSKKRKREEARARALKNQRDLPFWGGYGSIDKLIRAIQIDNIRALKKELKAIRKGEKVRG